MWKYVVISACYLAIIELVEIINCGGRRSQGSNIPQSDKQEDGKLDVVNS